MSIILYSYYRSSASFRVRIALNIKRIDYEILPVHLLRGGGEQHSEEYLRINPQGLVPTLTDGGTVLTQSSAIIEYLEEVYPTPALLPESAVDRAYMRSLVQLIACDIHPLNNLRVLQYLKETLNYDDAQHAWYCHWIQKGFSAMELLLEQHDCNGLSCLGNGPGMADVFLVPQVYNALRFNCPMHEFPLISRIYENCMQQSAFLNAAPENQPDAEK
jgi:maleylacetoacetate isomerase